TGTGLGGQAGAGRGVPDPGPAELGAPPAAARGPAVLRRPPGTRPLQPAGGPRPDGPHRVRRRGDPRDRAAPRGHAGLLPRPLPAEISGCRGRCLVGFGDLRHPRPRFAAARADPGTPSGYPGARGRADRPVPHRRRPGRRADRRRLTDPIAASWVPDRPWPHHLRTGLALRRRLATASYVWIGCRVARIRLMAARTPRTTEEPHGN